MAKSLKEALLEKFSDLQELGIAPTTAPAEDEGPSVVVEMGPESRRDNGGRRQRSGGVSGYEDEPRRGGDLPVRPRTRPRRPERGERPRPGGERFRRGERPQTGERLPFGDVAPPLDRPSPPGRPGPGGRPPLGDRPSLGDRPQFGGRPPLGDRPRPGPGGRPPGPPGAGPQHSVTDRLRQRAEQRRREDELRETLQGLLASTSGSEPGPETFDKFLADLTQEVGALPPLERVVEAVQMAKSVEPFKVGQQIRALYRRRPRPSAPPR